MTVQHDICPGCEQLRPDDQIIGGWCRSCRQQGYAPMMTVAQRRGELADWLYRHRAEGPHSASEIVERSGIYGGMHGRYDTCLRDLQRLERNRVLIRAGATRPARFSHRVQ